MYVHSFLFAQHLIFDRIWPNISSKPFFLSQIILLSWQYKQNYSNSENNLIYIISYSNIPTLSNEKNTLCVHVNRFKIQDMFILFENFSTVKVQKKRTQQRCLIGNFYFILFVSILPANMTTWTTKHYIYWMR